MKYTRQTKLFRATDDKNIEVIYKTLSISELYFLDKIRNPLLKAEMAYDLGYISGNEPNFFAKHQIGLSIIHASSLEVNDDMLLGMTIDEFRSSTRNDNMMIIIMNILEIIPNTTIDYLFNLTYLDLLELGALCERMTNKKLFTIDTKSVLAKTEKVGDGKSFFQDDGKTLQDKMKEMKEF